MESPSYCLGSGASEEGRDFIVTPVSSTQIPVRISFKSNVKLPGNISEVVNLTGGICPQAWSIDPLSYRSELQLEVATMSVAHQLSITTTRILAPWRLLSQVEHGIRVDTINLVPSILRDLPGSPKTHTSVDDRRPTATISVSRFSAISKRELSLGSSLSIVCLCYQQAPPCSWHALTSPRL
ncbi:hypothetical protein NMY22_g3451 [Coprinellus aureogranulatus]|nr:hypothetical protein NMY22_g3451 [Coprinellus aureogranulatus]